MENGPSTDYMQLFYQRHRNLSFRSGETVDRGRINMENQETVSHYFDLLKETLVHCGIATLDGEDNVESASILERIYSADETNDESHKALMLGICGNGDVIKSYLILEKSFPLLGEDETDNIPKNILLSKTENGSMEKPLYTDWIKQSVIPHKQVHNPEGMSLLILDNNGSRFCIEAIKLCKGKQDIYSMLSQSLKPMSYKDQDVVLKSHFF